LQNLGDRKAELLVMHKTGLADMEVELQLRRKDVHKRQPDVLAREMALDGLLASSMKLHEEVRCAVTLQRCTRRLMIGLLAGHGIYQSKDKANH